MSSQSSPIFNVGQRVICINDSFPPAIHDWCDQMLVAGHIYTIRAMQVGRNDRTGNSNLGLLLVEIINPLSGLGYEAGFVHTRFIPWLDCAHAARLAQNHSPAETSAGNANRKSNRPDTGFRTED